jgi:uncharacterized protein
MGAGRNGRKWTAAGAALAVLVAAAPAIAQGSDSYKFLKAVRERDNNTLIDMLAQPDSVVNTRDSGTGETALHIVIKRRDTQYLSFLLSKKADPNVKSSAGVPPLVDAATIGFAEGEQQLLDHGAKVDLTNGSGETALIRAVQNRDLESVRLLLAAGADPDLRDRIAGRSARDYAAADTRSTAVAKLIAETPRKAPKVISGPKL